MMILRLFLIVFMFGVTAPGFTSCNCPESEEFESPLEDLMIEHGVLNRLMLIYDEVAKRIETHTEFPVTAIHQAATIMRTFIQNHHEKLEENYVFPRFEQAGQLVSLVKTLREQHEAGRHLTDYVLLHANEEEMQDDIQRLILGDYLKLYVRMYRPHEAREDTVLFPAFKKLVSVQEYQELGELFEDLEHQRFGKGGLKKILQEITEIEKSLNINTLSDFTPKLKS